MVKRTTTLPLVGVSLDPTASLPLHRQLYQQLREAVLSGRLAAGARLPSTRTFAHDLGCSRTTVLTAFEQLLAEGYLEGKVGAGTYVTSVIADSLIQPVSQTKTDETKPRLSYRSTMMAKTPSALWRRPGNARAFRPGVPDLTLFPYEIWAQLSAKHWRHASSSLLGHTEPQGYRPLREAIASYLTITRAIQCDAEQVILVAGSQQGLDLAARVLLDPEDTVWVDDPGYIGARNALLGVGAQPIPVPVDREGLNVAAGEVLCPQARAAYVMPSNHFPLGVTMSLARRIALLAWAHHSGAWIIEDDYDSEYRYTSRPLAALQGLDSHGHVIYIGTFSKVLFPSLCIGYVVAPPPVVDAFVAARTWASVNVPLFEQVILTDFLTEGHFARHIRRMRDIYAERQALTYELVQRELAGVLEVQPTEAGMHLVGWLPNGKDDEEAFQQAIAAGVETWPLSRCGIGPVQQGGLLLGYAGVPESDIRVGVQRLAKALSTAP